MIAMIAFKLRTVDRWGAPILGSVGLGVIHSNKWDLWWVLGVFAFENTCFCVVYIHFKLGKQMWSIGAPFLSHVEPFPCGWI